MRDDVRRQDDVKRVTG